MEITQRDIEEISRVRASLDDLAGFRLTHGGDTAIFGWANPTPAERERVQALGRETPWNTARAGVTLIMPQDRAELSTRINEHQTAQQHIRATRERQAKVARRTR